MSARALTHRELLAGSLGVPRCSVRVVAGETARLKIVDVEGVDAAAFERLTSGRT